MSLPIKERPSYPAIMAAAYATYLEMIGAEAGSPIPELEALDLVSILPLPPTAPSNELECKLSKSGISSSIRSTKRMTLIDEQQDDFL